jgi:hypothetical protein
VQASAGRAGPDPLTLVPPGDQGGVLLGFDLVRSGGREAEGPYRVEPRGNGARVVFTLEKDGAVEVEVLGDFNGWQAQPMSLIDGEWTLEVEVEPGTFHYGFMVDGEWYVPEGLPGNVPDEWGRENATLVVPLVGSDGS